MRTDEGGGDHDEEVLTKLDEGIWPLHRIHLGAIQPPKLSC
jgi:hypothetical protein